MRILITGSNGFVGRSIGRFAAHNGCEILGVDLARVAGADWPGRYLQADVAQEDLSALIRSFVPDVFLHAAGTASVGDSLAAPFEDLQGAVLTWARTLDSVRRSEVKPLLVYPSSAAVYGNPHTLPVPEHDAIAPISPYGYHKAACELLAREYSACFELDIIVCRLFSIFGAAQKRLLIWELYKQLAGSDSTVWLEGTGKESRDYLHIDDVGAALFHLIGASPKGGRHGRCLQVNVARGEETQVLDLAEQLRNLAAPTKQICCRGVERPGDPRRWCADISLLRSLIPSWQPKPLSFTLAQCVAEWRDGSNP